MLLSRVIKKKYRYAVKYLSNDVARIYVQNTNALRNAGFVLNEQSLIEALNQGKLVTTTWHDSDMQTVIEDVATGNVVAKVLSQQIDGEYCDFR